jgi:hypothetical protein
MLTPPIGVPAVIEKNRSLWLEHFYSLMAVVETETGASDTIYTLDNRMMTMRRRPLSLAPYAGQTIRVRLLNNNSYSYSSESIVDRIRVDYDTVPVVVLSAQQQTTTDSATLFVATQLRGYVPGLSYSWQSQVGGTFVTNATGDSAWVTYSTGITGFDDTVSVTATNSYCSYTTRKAIGITDCLPVDTLPWVEAFTDGMPCWYKPAGSNWQAATYYGYDPKYIISNKGSDTMAHWVMSKAVTLPANPALGVTLFWDVAGSNNTAHHNYGVWVTTSEDYTDTLNYTLLYLDTNTHTNFRTFDHLSAPLAAYAGQTIHVAFRNIRQQQTHLYIDNVTIRATALPTVTLATEGGQESYYYGDTATLIATLTQGDTTGLTYTWHSTLLDSTWSGGDTTHIFYGLVGGLDTVSVTATNSFGSHTATVEIYSTIVTEPAVDEFTAEGKEFFMGEDRAEVGDTVVYAISRYSCVTTGLTYWLHSTLLDTTVSVATTDWSCQIPLYYGVGGTDTLTAWISNSIETSTEETLYLKVESCAAVGVPFFENFDNLGEAYEYVPCWPGYYWLQSHGDTNMAARFAGVGTHYSLISPAIDLPADTLGLQLSWYTEFSSNATPQVPIRIMVSPTGSAHIADFTDVILDGPVPNYSYDTLSLDAYRGQRVRIAFTMTSYYILFDDIRVDYDRTAPDITIVAPEQAYTLDSLPFSAQFASGSPQGASYTWHSVFGTVSGSGEDVVIYYSAPCTDTVTVAVTTAYGSDTAVAIVEVTDHPLPEIVSLTPVSNTQIGDTLTIEATLNDLSPNGLRYYWHSSLTGLTDSTGATLQLPCSVEGTDTVTFIVSNLYGADTATLVFAVVNCNGRALPYVEDFSGVTPTASNVSGELPACWDYYWNGSNVAYAPHVINSTGYQYISGLTDNALLFVAGGSTGYGSTAIAYLPHFADSLQHLALALDYRFESSTRGLLAVGWFDDNEAFHTVKTLSGHQGSYLRDTVFFTDQIAADYRIALWWEYGSSWYAAVVDNLEVFVDNSIRAPADLAVDSVGYHCVSLSWQPVAGASAYQVSLPGVTDTTVATTAVTLCGLAINNQYTASVAAIVDGDTGQNATVTFSTPSLNPAMLAARSVGAHCAGLSWSPCSGALAYHVVVDGVGDTIVSDTAVFFCGLASNTTYSASVAGVNGADTGIYVTVQFSTPCIIDGLPWSENFQGSSPLACWSKKGAGYYYGMQVCTESYWAEYCHSGSRGLQLYNYTEGNTLVVSTPVIEAPADEMLVSFWVCNPNEVGGLLEAGVITDPTDSTTFVPLMQCTMTDIPTRYEFDTRNVTVSGYAALAFRTAAYCTAMIIDDINVEQISACARLRSVGSYALDARSAVVEWQYDTASAIPNTGALVTLTDLTNSSIAPVVVSTTGSSYTFYGLSLGHRYQASVQALCADDTTIALTTEVVPSGNACAEVTGVYNSGWFLMNCDRPYSYSQSLYPAVLAASVDTLYGIAYHITSSSVEPYPSSINTYSNGPRMVDVYIGQTASNTLSTPVSASGLTLAVQNFQFPLTDTGWVHINFTTPVPLDGVSNLIVTLDDNTGAIYGDVEFSHHTADIGTCFRTSTSSYSYTQTYDPYNPTGFSTYAGTQIPDIQLLGGCSNSRCLQPIAAVTDEGEHSVSLGWQQRGSETQWQVEYHVDGDSTWIVAGITGNTTYTVSGLNVGTGYRLRVASLCTGDTIYSDILSAHTQCGVVSLPYHQTFRNYDMPSTQSSITEGGTPCWQTGNIYLLSQGRGLWNTHQNGDYIISPAIGIDLSLVKVTLSASGSTFFNAGLKVGACDSTGGNLVWLDTITLSNSAQDYTVYLNNYSGSDHYLAIGGSYQTWTLYDVLLEQAASCLPPHHIALSYLGDDSIALYWPPIDATHSWAVYLDGTLLGTTNNASYTLSGLTPNTEYLLGVREICAVGDTSEFTTLAVTTLCSSPLPYSENFDSYEHYSLPDCWYLNERPHTGSANAWILNNTSAGGELRMGDSYSPYEDEDTLANFISTPMLQVGDHPVSISFVARGVTSTWGTCQVGIMSNAADTNSFIPLATITPTTSDTLYQLSTSGMRLPEKYSLAFRWYGYTYCSVDDINMTAIIPPSHTLTLAVNDPTMGSVEGSGTYEEGTEVVITAMANEGYHFVMWNDSVTVPQRTVKVDSDTTFTAYFAADIVWNTVTVNAVMDNGSHYDGLDEMIHGAGTYAGGSTVTLEGEVHGCATSFVFWVTTDGDTITDNPYTFVIHSDTTFTAVFRVFGGIEEASPLTALLYPNPATASVTVEVGQSATATIIDATGHTRLRMTLAEGRNEIDLRTLEAGAYFVRLVADDRTAVQKLVVK